MAKRSKVTRKDKSGKTTFAELKAQAKRRGITEAKDDKPMSLEALAALSGEVMDFLASRTNYHGERMYVLGQCDAVVKARMGQDLVGGGIISLGNVLGFEPDPKFLFSVTPKKKERPRPKSKRMPHGHEDDDVD